MLVWICAISAIFSGISLAFAVADKNPSAIAGWLCALIWIFNAVVK